MAKVVTALSDTKIKSLKAQDKDYTISDGQDLYILVKTNGCRLWIYRYTSPTTQKIRKTSFGNYPQTTLKTARAKRDEYINLVNQGIDPLEDKAKTIQDIKIKESSNFKVIADEWLDFESKRTMESTHRRKVATFKNDIYPYFARKSINDITHQEIIKIVELKTKKGIEASNKLYRQLGTVWKYAITKGLCKYNPFNDFIKDMIIPKNETQHFAKVTNEDILKDLVNGIYRYDGHHSTRAMLRFVLHMPLRATNLVNLKWEYIDFDECSLTIPRKLMKTKNINLPDFKMPLTNEVIKILKDIAQYTSHQEFVFLGTKGTPIHPNSPNMGLKRMGFIDDRKQTLHSFRGTFRSLVETHQQEHNASFEVKERVLDHHNESRVVLSYSHQAEYFEQMKPLMNWWSDYIVGMRVRRRIKKRI